ncbi:hypothetical protein F5884DRAFT_631487, partial [Xylogone sp. PMI_703]
MATSLASTILTMGGTPTVFLPLPTAWPAGDDCTSNLYLHTPVSNPNTFLAWDPLYGESMVTSASSCLPPQVTAWWNQGSSNTPYTALGPTFVCPEAYSAVQTVLVAKTLQQMFCCPSQYSLLIPQPNKAKVFPSQCISTIDGGQTVTYLSQQASPDQFTATVVMDSAATIFAIPVNGFNFVTEDVSALPTTPLATLPSSEPTSTVPSTAPLSTAPSGPDSQSDSNNSPSSSLSTGSIVGIVVGVFAAGLLVGIAAFVLWRRQRER